MKINDAQHTAIFDAISSAHTVLGGMYNEKERLEKKHKEELDDFIQDIKKQEEKVGELCEGKIKFYMDSDDRLILDLS